MDAFTKKYIYRVLFVLCGFFISSAEGFAQRIETDFIVQIKENREAVFFRELPTFSSARNSISEQLLSPDLNVYLVQTENLEEAKQLRSYLGRSSIVKSFGNDYFTSPRTKPSDELFGGQWSLRNMKLENAWDIAVGEVDFAGNQIVVAVMDDGFDFEHEDMQNHWFTNEAEVPNNNIDDDGNGFTDDYLGVNIEGGGDSHPRRRHGLAVSAIISADTDNNIGMAGVTWGSKILPLSGVDRQSTIIQGYQYILELRRKYNASQGKEGAFIVATNYSAGIDGVFGTSGEFTAWCEMYDLLGEHGILSVGATTNSEVNVDLDGDMPTTCPSEYLIAVSASDRSNQKKQAAGYGPINIDIVAPGDETVSLDLTDSYSNFNGTSSSAPHVAGVIALAYSSPCGNLATLAETQPERAASLVRDAIYSSVTKVGNLEGTIATGGVVNAERALEEVQDRCEELVGFSSFQIDYPYRCDQDVCVPINRGGVIGETVTFRILDLSSKIHDRGEATVYLDDMGRNAIRLDTAELAAGLYWLSVIKGKEVSTALVFKQ